MATDTDISNFALQHLGESRISSLIDTGDKVSRTCAICYPQARDEALSIAPWSCAKKPAALSKLTAQPLYKWSAAYQLPPDFIRLIEIAGCDAWAPREYFDRMGNVLYIGRGDWYGTEEDADSINIEYIWRQTDATQFDPLLVECIAMKMAMKMAKTLTGSDAKAKELREEYERVVLPQARTLNAQQLYSGRNHPIRQQFRRGLLTRGYGGDPGACPPGSGALINEDVDADATFNGGF